MQNPLNQIVSSVFGESRLEDVSHDALHLLTVKYPFSAPVQLLYARRLKDAGDSRYGEAVSIAALHYANPHWLQHQLSAPIDAEAYAANTPSEGEVLRAEAEAENREMEALPPGDGDSVPDRAYSDEDAVGVGEDTDTDTNTPEPEATISELHSGALADGASSVSEEFQDNSGPSAIADEGGDVSVSPSDVRAESTATEAPSLSEEAVDTGGPSATADEEGDVSESPSDVRAESTATVAPSLAEEALDTGGPSATADEAGGVSESPSDVQAAYPAVEAASYADQSAVISEASDVSEGGGIEAGQVSVALPSVETDTGITTLYEGETTEVAREIGDSELIHVTMPDTHTDSCGTQDETVNGVLSETGGASEEQLPTGGDLSPSHEPVEALLSSGEGSGKSSADGGSDTFTDELPLPVEPLHLSDYLASQGIVVSSELEPKGDWQAERSFTGWLRTMKRLQPDRSAPILSEEEEDAIRSEAEASNQDEDVVTEAMAEVYARQGLIQKSIDIYTKLSLLDPDRTSTFADRITQLKALLT